jgi:hypothetical protein
MDLNTISLPTKARPIITNNNNYNDNNNNKWWR